MSSNSDNVDSGHGRPNQLITLLDTSKGRSKVDGLSGAHPSQITRQYAKSVNETAVNEDTRNFWRQTIPESSTIASDLASKTSSKHNSPPTAEAQPPWKAMSEKKDRFSKLGTSWRTDFLSSATFPNIDASFLHSDLLWCHRPVSSYHSLPAVYVEASEDEYRMRSPDVDKFIRSAADPEPAKISNHLTQEDWHAHSDRTQGQFGTKKGGNVIENKIHADHRSIGVSISSSESDFVEQSSRSTQTSHHSHKNLHSKRSGHGSKKKISEDDIQRNTTAGYEDDSKFGDRMKSSRTEIETVIEEEGIISTESEKKEGPEATDFSSLLFKEKLETKRKELESSPPVGRQTQSAVSGASSNLLQDEASLLSDKTGVVNNSLGMPMDPTMLWKNDKEIQLPGETTDSSPVTGDILRRSRESAIHFHLHPFTISRWDWTTNAQLESIKQNRRERQAELLSKLRRSPSASTYGEEPNGSCIESSAPSRFQKKLVNHRINNGSSRSESVCSSQGRGRGRKLSRDRDRRSHETVARRATQDNIHALTAPRVSLSVGVRGKLLFWRLVFLVGAHTALWLPALLLVQISEESLPHFMNPSMLTLLLLAWLRPLVGSVLLLWFTLKEP